MRITDRSRSEPAVFLEQLGPRPHVPRPFPDDGTGPGDRLDLAETSQLEERMPAR